MIYFVVKQKNKKGARGIKKQSDTKPKHPLSFKVNIFISVIKFKKIKSNKQHLKNTIYNYQFIIEPFVYSPKCQPCKCNDKIERKHKSNYLFNS